MGPEERGGLAQTWPDHPRPLRFHARPSSFGLDAKFGGRPHWNLCSPQPAYRAESSAVAGLCFRRMAWPLEKPAPAGRPTRSARVGPDAGAQPGGDSAQPRGGGCASGRCERRPDPLPQPSGRTEGTVRFPAAPALGSDGPASCRSASLPHVLRHLSRIPRAPPTGRAVQVRSAGFQKLGKTPRSHHLFPTVAGLIARKLLFWPGHGKRLESRLGPEERGGLI